LSYHPKHKQTRRGDGFPFRAERLTGRKDSLEHSKIQEPVCKDSERDFSWDSDANRTSRYLGAGAGGVGAPPRVAPPAPAPPPPLPPGTPLLVMPVNSIFFGS